LSVWKGVFATIALANDGQQNRTGA